jgi:hypothetical protein
MKVKAFAGDREIDLNAFIEMYVGNVFVGIANSLHGVKLPRRLEFAVERGGVAITADGDPIVLSGFAAGIVGDTVSATLKHLKGFSPTDPVRIVIEL